MFATTVACYAWEAHRRSEPASPPVGCWAPRLRTDIARALSTLNMALLAVGVLSAAGWALGRHQGESGKKGRTADAGPAVTCHAAPSPFANLELLRPSPLLGDSPGSEAAAQGGSVASLHYTETVQTDASKFPAADVSHAFTRWLLSEALRCGAGVHSSAEEGRRSRSLAATSSTGQVKAESPAPPTVNVHFNVLNQSASCDSREVAPATAPECSDAKKATTAPAQVPFRRRLQRLLARMACTIAFWELTKRRCAPRNPTPLLCAVDRVKTALGKTTRRKPSLLTWLPGHRRHRNILQVLLGL